MTDRSKPKILIAEDEVIVAMDIQMRLESAGYQVVASVISGEDAIRKALDTHPDLALMDIGLKGDLDGIAAADEIHRQLDIPVVYLTSYSNRTILERAKLSEAYGYLLKPFEERTLLSTLEVALYKHSLDREVKQREAHFRRLIENISDMIVVLTMMRMSPMSVPLR
jgi:CheY-like chemotaxis protein